MDKERFEYLVYRVVEELPEEFLERLDNVEVVVEDRPTTGQITRAGIKRGYTLMGLYEGIPQTRRSRHYGMVLPDKITIFQQPIENKCRTENEIAGEIERVVKHELAHHFGIDDDRLAELEREKD